MPGLAVALDSRTNNAWVLSLVGRPLPTDGDALDAAIDEAVTSRPRMLVLDCSKLEFIGSYGIGALLRLDKQVTSAGGAVRLAAVSPMIMKILQASRLDERLPVFPDVESALK